MSKASNLAGFATAVSPPSNLTVGVITATTVSATTITGSLTGTASTATASATAFGLSGTPNITVGVITATGASISGNVTVSGNVGIAGTLTYEDVTNVDSVGLITARSGVNVTGGSVVVGSAVTLSSGGIRVGVVTATTVSAAASVTSGTFYGSGAGLNSIPSSAITGLSGGSGRCVFTGPGTFTVPSGTTSLKITSIGGGGPGTPGSPYVNPSGTTLHPAGGGAGSAAVKLLSVPPACSSYPVTVGGAAGDTIFGGPTVFLTEGGCAGCLGDPNGSIGGRNGNCGFVPSTGTYALINGSTGTTGNLCGSPGGSGPGGPCGFGQNSIFGVGGRIGSCNGSGYGSGGGSGGTGAPGFVIVEW